MLWLWILLAVVLLIALLLWTRVGVWAAYDGENLRLDARIGLLRVHILPAKVQKPGAEKPKKRKKAKRGKPEEEPPEKTGKPKLSIAWEDVRDALHTLLPALKRALGRTRRGIRVKPLRLSVTLGGQEDPAGTAQLYGEIQAAVWTGMPVLEKLVDIRDPHIHIGLDFNTPDLAAEGEAGVTFRIGTLLAIGFRLAVPALRWFLRWWKRCKTRPPKAEKTPPATEDSPPAPPARKHSSCDRKEARNG